MGVRVSRASHSVMTTVVGVKGVVSRPHLALRQAECHSGVGVDWERIWGG